ncbi:MAG TPA: hypothetical protein V6C72_14925, partial [Chroococcales cyanobacterium]
RGLAGCYATAVDIETAGARDMVLTHFPITSESHANLRALANLVPNNPDAKLRATIFAPDTHDIIEGIHQSFMRNVSAILRDVPLKLHEYPALGDLSARDFGSIRFRLPTAPADKIEFKTWFSQGTID